MNGRPQHWIEGWHVSPSQNKDYEFIDGLRGIAILMVLACHLLYTNPSGGDLTRFIGGVLAAAGHGVTLFFALSGFLISWPFWKRKINGNPDVVPPGYGWRRFWKIYPPLFLSIALLLPIYFLRTHDPMFVKVALQWVIGLPVILPITGQFNPVMWSLLVEIHFYFVLPVLFLCFKKLSPKATLWNMFLLFLIGPALFRWISAAHGIVSTLHPDINVLFPSQMDVFAFGVLIAGLENMGLIKRTWARFGDIGFVLFGTGLVVSSWMTLHEMSQSLTKELVGWIIKIAAALLLTYVADPGQRRVRLLCMPWLRWCGLISYEWYLLHQPLALWTRSIFGPAEGNIVKYAAIVGGPLIVGLMSAALIYKYFSLPILRQGRARHANKPAPKPPQTAKLQNI